MNSPQLPRWVTCARGPGTVPVRAGSAAAAAAANGSVIRSQPFGGRRYDVLSKEGCSQTAVGRSVLRVTSRSSAFISSFCGPLTAGFRPGVGVMAAAAVSQHPNADRWTRCSSQSHGKVRTAAFFFFFFSSCCRAAEVDEAAHAGGANAVSLRAVLSRWTGGINAS